MAYIGSIKIITMLIFKVCVRIILLLTFSFFLFSEGNSQGLKWTPDGSGYYRAEAGEIVQYGLPGNVKTVLVNKMQLTPEGQTKSLAVRSFSFSQDGTAVLIFTNTKRVWRLETRGDYWVFDKTSNKLKQLGKGRPVSSLMFAKFSPDATKVAYVSEYNLYVEDLGSGEIKALTKDGNRKFINGTFDWA